MHCAPLCCFRCKSLDIITDNISGDVVCRECGEIIGAHLIDESSEWRMCSSDDQIRVSTLDMDKISSTVFSGGNVTTLSSLNFALVRQENTKKVAAAHHVERFCRLLFLSHKIEVS